MKQTEELKRSAFTISVAAEAHGRGDVHWRSDEYVTLSGALAVLSSYKAELREKVEMEKEFYENMRDGWKRNTPQWNTYHLAVRVHLKMLALLEDNPTEKVVLKKGRQTDPSTIYP